jgi:hypothetical protein
LVQSEASATAGPTLGGTLAEQIAGPPAEAELMVVCGRLQATYGMGLGLFDHLRAVLVVDFSDQPEMQRTFEELLREDRAAAPAGHVMMSALMNQCLVQVFRRRRCNPCRRDPPGAH